MKFRCSQVRHVQAHHDFRCLANPPTGRRARDPAIRRDGHVPGALDEIAKPVIVALLRAGRGRHVDDHRPFAHAGSTPQTNRGRCQRETVRRGDPFVADNAYRLNAIAWSLLALQLLSMVIGGIGTAIASRRKARG